MDINQGKYFDWVESSVVEDFDSDFVNTFSLQEKDSNLDVTRFFSTNATDIVDRDVTGLKPQKQQAFYSTDLDYLAASPDTCQIFCIRQKNSYSRLHITQDLFLQLVTAYGIFNRIWDIVLPFNFKTRESDIGHAPFRFRQTQPVFVNDGLGTFECAYGFRYVIQNHRTEAAKGNLDYDPWSVRQSAVYQQYNSKDKRFVIILVVPSEAVKSRLQEVIQKRIERRLRINAFDLHRIIVSTLFENWRLYIKRLEQVLKHESDRVTLAHMQSQTEKLSPLTDFNLNFIDRQRLKLMEDKILDLLIIFESLNHTVSQLQIQCRAHCVMGNCPDCTCSMTIWELEEQKREGELNIKKAEVLHKRAQGTAQLLSNLLEYENAQIAHRNGNSLFELAAESKNESFKMRLLTERSTRDAAAVKILTLITLIYLPITVIASIFSSQLVRFDDNGQISVAADAWWFAVIAIPLTIITFVVWKYWLVRTIKRQEKEDAGLHRAEV